MAVTIIDQELGAWLAATLRLVQGEPTGCTSLLPGGEESALLGGSGSDEESPIPGGFGTYMERPSGFEIDWEGPAKGLPQLLTGSGTAVLAGALAVYRTLLGGWLNSQACSHKIWLEFQEGARTYCPASHLYTSSASPWSSAKRKCLVGSFCQKVEEGR